MDSLAESLRKIRKLAFVCSAAGKPVFCTGVNEESIADVMATAQALVSVSQACTGTLRSLKSQGCTLCFLDKNPLTLVAVSHLKEPVLVLRMQLVLLHAQIVSLLTAKALASIFDKHPGYDVRKLVAGSEHILQNLFDSFSKTPGAMLGAYPSMAMEPRVRRDMSEAMRVAIEKTGASFGILVHDNMVVSHVGLEGSKSRLIHWDILLLLNFVKSNVSLRVSETMTSLCLPFFDENGNFFAYIRYLDNESESFVVFLSDQPTSDVQLFQEGFRGVEDAWNSHIDHHACRLEQFLPDSVRHVEYDFIFKSSTLFQYVWSGGETVPSHLPVEDALIRYGQMRAGMFALDGESPQGPLQAFRFEDSGPTLFVGFASSKAELFVCFEKEHVSQEDAIQVAQSLRDVLLARSDILFS